ncbi:MAG: hypothetical protein H6819_11600 [Phycisphaerales bacterium]|nr:hypothetical protein [Phycisphaerales bacterium]MCB9856785.1 hypothetical protein [Phycisphaerales bacterium]MCB9862088.1 hypothetical protein [Phycisphaerales bacterium]
MKWTIGMRDRIFGKWACLFSALAVGFATSAGCKQPDPAPEPEKTAVAAKESDARKDSALMGSFIRENAGASSTPTGALPAGHPSVPGMTPPPVDASKLPEGHPPLPAGMRLAGSGDSPSGPPPDLSDLPIAFDVPKAWIAEAPSMSMRKAQFRLPHADGDSNDGDMVVYFFGKNQGGDVASNIDRWVGQFTTMEGDPIPDSSRVIGSLEVNGMKVTTLDVAGKYSNASMMGAAATPNEGPQRMLAAIVETPGGRWFFKGTGPVDTMAKYKSAFEEMLNSLAWKSDGNDGGA